jgi:hypothetical protein
LSLLILGVRANCVKWRAHAEFGLDVTAQRKKNSATVANKRGPLVKGDSAASRRTSSANTPPKLTVLTVGHSTRTIEEFFSILKAHGVQRLVDVRGIPKSRRVPQFNSDALAASLREQGIDYVHLKSLGGRRQARKGSVNTGWRNSSFRGYADYMATDEFRIALERLLQIASEKRTAIMCAEAVPWRCHRSLIGDALLVRGVHVDDIMSATSARPHEITPFAKVDGLEISYPADDDVPRQASLALFNYVARFSLLRGVVKLFHPVAPF